MNESELAEVCAAAHANARAKGFWDFARNRGEMVALMHSEVSEAYDDIRGAIRSTKIPGFALLEEEMADVVIRLADFCYAEGIDLAGAVLTIQEGDDEAAVSEFTREVRLLRMHHHLSMMLEAIRKPGDFRLSYYCGLLWLEIVGFSLESNVRLWPAIYAKMSYNSRRPRMHGKKF